MTILVTGGTGFLGSYFTRHAVLEEGARVVVFDRYPDPGRIADVLDRVTLIEGDIADAAAVAAAIADHGVDRIAHFAFILGSPTPGKMVPYTQVQCGGTAIVYEAARLAGVKRLVFCSSVAAYGRQDAEVLTEDLPVAPSGPYGFFKVWAEALGRYYTAELGLEVANLRFGSTFGLGRAARGSYRSGLLGEPGKVHYMARIEDAARGRAIELPNADALADWTYAADAAQAAWRALTIPRLPHDLYNVASERTPIGACADALRRLLPDVAITTSATERPGNAHPPMSNRRIVEELGFAPRYTLEAGLADYIERVRAYDAYRAAHG